MLAPHVSLQNDLRSPRIAFLLLCFRLSSRRMAGSSCFSSAKEQRCSAYQSHASAFKSFFGSRGSFAARHANSRILLPSLACGMKKKEISEKPQEHGTHGDQSMLAGLCRCSQQIAELPESLKNGHRIQGSRQACKLPNPDTGRSEKKQQHSASMSYDLDQVELQSLCEWQLRLAACCFHLFSWETV